MSPSTNLLDHLRSTRATAPYPITFTVSTDWYSRAGTVAHAIALTSEAVRGKVSITSRDEGVGSWRPSSIFGLFSTASEIRDVSIDVEEEDDLEGGTIKARTSMDSEKCSTAATASTGSRLSTLFTDWIVPSSDPAEHAVAKNRVSGPSELLAGTSKRFATLSRSNRRTSGLAGLGIDSVDVDDADIDDKLELLMVSAVFLSSGTLS